MPQAIRSYQLQTFVNRELLILADGEDVRDLLPPDDPSIRLVHLEGRAQIGDKRNLGCEMSTGEFIAHWDDDDYSAPGRLEQQAGLLATSGKAVTGYRRMRFTDNEGTWWEFRGNPLYVVGTSLVYRRDWWERHPFPAVQIGEDGAFVGVAARAGQLAVGEDAGDLMYATIHAGNTSTRQLSGANWVRL